jgi:hypothetical protein
VSSFYGRDHKTVEFRSGRSRWTVFCFGSPCRQRGVKLVLFFRQDRQDVAGTFAHTVLDSPSGVVEEVKPAVSPVTSPAPTPKQHPHTPASILDTPFAPS